MLNVQGLTEPQTVFLFEGEHSCSLTDMRRSRIEMLVARQGAWIRAAGWRYPLQSSAMSTSLAEFPGPLQLSAKVQIRLADERDRSEIYKLRHQIYALELGQHHANPEHELKDLLDEYNIYVKATVAGKVAGFVSITPPGRRYSVDKYFRRDVFPFHFDSGLYEVRLLTVLPEYRRKPMIAALLMYAALRWVEAQGGKRIVAIGRQEVLSLYAKAGLRSLGHSARSGAVTYELLAATVEEIRANASRHTKILERLKAGTEWKCEFPFTPTVGCRHGGESFRAIGEDFDHLERAGDVINADVLDAWFPPSPGVISSLEQHLPFLIRTSPPTDAAGLIRAISRTRGVPSECVVPAAGSSELIFLALREWLTAKSRVLLLDPSYGEYAHVTERVVGCAVDRLALSREQNYQLDLGLLESHLVFGKYDLAVIVNPNSPTGGHVSREKLEGVLRQARGRTRVWIDETYVEYAGEDQSLETFATKSRNVVVCKSMSKVYALSGVRAAYLCAPPAIAARLREISPPWAVSLPAQVAAVRALEDREYYVARYEETGVLRERLASGLQTLGLEVFPSVANFLLCHLPKHYPDAAFVAHQCRERGVYIRDAGEISRRLGDRALRIAVMDEESNGRMLRVLREVLRDGDLAHV